MNYPVPYNPYFGYNPYLAYNPYVQNPFFKTAAEAAQPNPQGRWIITQNPSEIMGGGEAPGAGDTIWFTHPATGQIMYAIREDAPPAVPAQTLSWTDRLAYRAQQVGNTRLRDIGRFMTHTPYGRGIIGGLAGAGIGAGISALSKEQRKNMIRNALIGLVAGAGLGAASKLVL